MEFNGGERVAAALGAQGVPVLFTLCGGHISPILVAAKACGIRVVDVRDEATAVFAADAFGRLTGVPGVAAVTAGPGLTNTITAVKNAQLAQSPLVLLCGAVPTALHGRGALQDIDQRAAIEPHVKLVSQVQRVADLVPALAEAFVVATSGVPGPVFVECPVDLLYDEATVRSWYADAAGKGFSPASVFLRWYLGRHVDRLFSARERAPRLSTDTSVPLASPGEIDAAAAALRKASRPLMIVGSQALATPANASLVASAVARLGVPVYLSGMARGLLGRDHPLHARHRRRDALRAADCVILAGVPCDFRLDYGRHIRRNAAVIAVNRSRKDATLNRRPTIAAIGDAGVFLADLAARFELEGSQWEGWLAELRSRDAEREREIDAMAEDAGDHVNPVHLLREIDRVAGENAVFVADGGDFVATASYVLRPRGPLGWLDPGAFGTLGVGAGFALGAHANRRESEVWIIFGDGASGYGLAEFDTFARHKIGVIAVVGNDASWAQIAREQVKLLHDDVGTVLARTAYHEVAAGFDAEGILVRRPQDVAAALEAARAFAREGRPVLVNVWLDRTGFREGSLSM